MERSFHSRFIIPLIYRYFLQIVMNKINKSKKGAKFVFVFLSAIALIMSMAITGIISSNSNTFLDRAFAQEEEQAQTVEDVSDEVADDSANTIAAASDGETSEAQENTPEEDTQTDVEPTPTLEQCVKDKVLLDGVCVSPSAPVPTTEDDDEEEVEPIVNEPEPTTNQTQNGDNIDIFIGEGNNTNDSATENNNNNNTQTEPSKVNTNATTTQGGPDQDCLFDPGLPKCVPGPDGKCPDGFAMNEDGQCFPRGGCPHGYHRVEDDESGRCISNTEGCPEGMIFTPSMKSCEYKEHVCQRYPELAECGKAPVAIADDVEVFEGGSVKLDASESNDPDGEIVSYNWLIEDEDDQCPPFIGQLNDRNSVSPTFTAASDVPRDCLKIYELVVTDNDGMKGSVNVVVTVKDKGNGPIAGSSVQISSNKKTYDIGETVKITVKNNGNKALSFADSTLGLKIKNLGNGETYTLIGAQVLTELNPGQSRNVAWQQENSEGKQVPSGRYVASLSVDSLSEKTEFRITEDKDTRTKTTTTVKETIIIKSPTECSTISETINLAGQLAPKGIRIIGFFDQCKLNNGSLLLDIPADKDLKLIAGAFDFQNVQQTKNDAVSVDLAKIEQLHTSQGLHKVSFEDPLVGKDLTTGKPKNLSNINTIALWNDDPHDAINFSSSNTIGLSITFEQ
jgi:hypothetical protein